MAWRKLGLVYSCNEKAGWRFSHAYSPTSLILDDRVRIYISIRDEKNIGRVGFVDLDRNNLQNILAGSAKPALDIGPLGAFDDSGVTPFSVLRHGDELRLYYMGWHLSVSVRYHLFTGLAISRDNGLTFERYSNVPVLDRTDQSWLLRSGASVLYDKNIWKCWFATGTHLIDLDGKLLPTYDWSYIESADGLVWPQEHKVAIPADLQNGILGYGHSAVIKDNDIYKAWIPIRTFQGYSRMAYVQSTDGMNWSPFDFEKGLLPSSEGFDSKEVCFPCVFDIGEHRYMVYNGNDFGRTGFGLAIWQA